jgi:hypothetical protein
MKDNHYGRRLGASARPWDIDDKCSVNAPGSDMLLVASRRQSVLGGRLSRRASSDREQRGRPESEFRGFHEMGDGFK